MDARPLLVLQAERIRIAAENNVRREMRRSSARLRQLLGHVSVLESCDEMQARQLPNDLPSYTEAVSNPDREPPTTCEDELPDVPELEGNLDVAANLDDEDCSSDEDGDTDDERDADHALVKVPSHPPIFDHEKGSPSWMLGGSKDLDPFKWAELASELAGKTDDEPSVTASLVEIVEVDD